MRPLLGWFPLVLVLTGCTPFDAVNGISPPLTTSRNTDLSYGPEPRQKLDVYRSRSQPTSAKAPIVVFLYGGGWQTGDKADYAFVARALAEEGIIVIVPDYRLYPDVTFPTFVEDAARAVRWTVDHAGEYGGDPARVHLMGHSAGAHIAALVAFNPRYLDAVGLSQKSLASFIGMSGPYDFEPREVDRAVFAIEGPIARDQLDPRIEPIAWAGANAPRTLLIQGGDDTLVKSDQPTKLTKELQAAGVPVQYREYKGVDHAGVVAALAWPLRWQAPIRRDVVEFVKQSPSK